MDTASAGTSLDSQGGSFWNLGRDSKLEDSCILLVEVGLKLYTIFELKTLRSVTLLS
jgi:hypothetical protein